MSKTLEIVGNDAEARLLTAGCSARYTGLSIHTLRSWAYKGKIASHKLGTRLMFSRAELDRIISESERPRLVRPSSKVSVYETRGPIIIGGDGE